MRISSINSTNFSGILKASFTNFSTYKSEDIELDANKITEITPTSPNKTSIYYKKCGRWDCGMIEEVPSELVLSAYAAALQAPNNTTIDLTRYINI